MIGYIHTRHKLDEWEPLEVVIPDAMIPDEGSGGTVARDSGVPLFPCSDGFVVLVPIRLPGNVEAMHVAQWRRSSIDDLPSLMKIIDAASLVWASHGLVIPTTEQAIAALEKLSAEGMDLN